MPSRILVFAVVHALEKHLSVAVVVLDRPPGGVKGLILAAQLMEQQVAFPRVVPASKVRAVRENGVAVHNVVVS